MNERNQEESVFQSIIILIVSITCLGVSWWSMATGYESFVNSFFMSAAIATVFVLILAGLNYSLRQGLKQGISGGRIATLLFVYLLVVALSFAGMFNKFYSEFMRKELFKEEITSKIENLRELESEANLLLISGEDNKTVKFVNRKLTELEQQITDSGNPGGGVRSRAIIKEIEVALRLNSPITPQTAKSNKTEDLKDLYKRYETLIKASLNDSEELDSMYAEKNNLLATVSESVKAKVQKLNDVKSELSSTSNQSAEANAVSVLNESVDEYHKLAKQITILVPPGKSFEYKKDLRFENDGVGRISHTFRSAIEHFPHWAVLVAAFLALGIDLIVPLFVSVMTTRGGNQSSSTGRLSNRNNRPTTLKNDF